MSETVVGERGMVTAPHRAAAEAGAAVLAEGGNALEATIAAAATIAVVYPHMNGIGGDAFALIAEPGRPPVAIDASGAAGSLATAARYAKAGYDRMPERGADAALTVAGAVSAWEMMAEAAVALGGRIPRRDLLGDAVRRAREGSAVTRSHARMLGENREALAAAPGFAATFMPDGKIPEEGAAFTQERLADTLERIAHAGYADFYKGDIAATLAADLEEAGTPVTRADLASHAARKVRPLAVRLSDATMWNTPAPTQGIASLIMLGLFDRLKVKRTDEFAFVHGLIEAAKRAYAVRDREVADPMRSGDLAAYLDPAWLDGEALAIDMRRAARWPMTERGGDTVWLGAIDGNGLAVSFIQSLYFEFGSGVVSPRTGVLWQNRGLSFSLDPASINHLAPGRKPFHTLNPPLARFDDGRTMVYGSMGGDGQPQFQAEIFARIARLGMDIGEAIAAPRWRFGQTWGEIGGENDSSDVTMEDRFDPDLVAALMRAGHRIRILAEGYSDSMGHAGALLRRADGRIHGASDPRSDGAAVAG